MGVQSMRRRRNQLRLGAVVCRCSALGAGVRHTTGTSPSQEGVQWKAGARMQMGGRTSSLASTPPAPLVRRRPALSTSRLKRLGEMVRRGQCGWGAGHSPTPAPQPHFAVLRCGCSSPRQHPSRTAAFGAAAAALVKGTAPQVPEGAVEGMPLLTEAALHCEVSPAARRLRTARWHRSATPTGSSLGGRGRANGLRAQYPQQAAGGEAALGRGGACFSSVCGQSSCTRAAGPGRGAAPRSEEDARQHGRGGRSWTPVAAGCARGPCWPSAGPRSTA